MESLISDAENIWFRVKKYIDLKKLKSVDSSSLKTEIKEALDNPSRFSSKPQGNLKNLLKSFPGVAVENEDILRDIQKENNLVFKQKIESKKGKEFFVFRSSSNGMFQSKENAKKFGVF